MNTCNGCKHFSDSVSQLGDEDNTFKVYACKKGIPTRLLYSTAEDHDIVPVPSDCPLPRWNYKSKNIEGGIPDAVKWLNENANNYDVVSMERFKGNISELGYLPSFVTIVWREKI